MLWTKRTHQRAIFQTFECSNESSPGSSYHFWNHKVYSNFVSLFIVMKDNSSVFCSSNLVHFEPKEHLKKKVSDFWVIGWNFTKFLMLYLKPQVNFSLIFGSLFSVMRDNSSVLFYLTRYMIWKEEPIKVQNFRLSTAHVKFHQICALIGSFCWKYIKFQLKKYRGVMSHDT